MSKLFEQLLRVRGVDESFLHPKYEDLADPYRLPDMRAAVERLKLAAKRGEKVLIYGDYDVDGVTASTVLFDTLKLIGVADVEVMLPNRFTDGYGMSAKVVERARAGGFSLVVTVDCGSRNAEVIDELLRVGVETIVTDHHECGEELPRAVAVVNPKRADADGLGAAEDRCGAAGDQRKVAEGLRDLAGVGVAFQLARALMMEGLLPRGQEKWLLDLVLIGTICDAMRISKENRILTYYGMKVLIKTRRPGLKELMRVAKVEKLDAEAIGFRIGPRLNAAGRMETAEIALKLLMTRDAAEAAALAEKLEKLNGARRDAQMRAVDEVRERGCPEEPVIVVSGEWHEGVLGIIAGRLVEEYRRPAFALALCDGVWKGSGRSFGDFNLAEALAACSDCIVGGGGHAQACGVKVAAECLGDFERAVNEYYRSLNLSGQEKYLARRGDMEMAGMSGLDLEFLQELEELEPYGEGNPEPLFWLKNLRVLEARKMGAEGRHLALLVEGGDGARMRLVGFSVPEGWSRLVGLGGSAEWASAGERVEWAGARGRVDALVRLRVNEFRGLKNVEGELVDLVECGAVEK